MSAAFGLYTAAACTDAQRVVAGQVFDLTQPVEADGATLFRRSLWLPVPAAARRADAVQLAEGAVLGLRFAPLDLDVAVTDVGWVPSYRADGKDLQLSLALPVPMTRVTGPVSSNFGLHRRDGKAVSQDPLQSGKLNDNLVPPFVGMDFALRFDFEVDDFQFGKLEVALVPGGSLTGLQRAAPGTAGSVQASPGPGGAIGVLLRRDRGPVDQLRLAGRPSTPRLRLLRPGIGGGADESLWQAIEPGEQSAALTLPAATPDLAEAWADALAAARAPAPAEGEPPVEDLLLRLEIESDAPCRVTVQSLSLALEAETDLLAGPQTLRFRGARRESLALAIETPVPAVRRLVLAAGVVGDAAQPPAPAAALPGEGRIGVLLDADRRALRAVDLAAPLRLAGLAIPWHALSDRVVWSLRWLADGAGVPAARPLLELRIEADTPASAWMALRWPALDLQAGRYWLSLGLTEGAGVWLADAGAVDGWVEDNAAPGSRQPLAAAPVLQTLAPGSASPAVELSIGAQSIALASAPAPVPAPGTPAPPLRLLALHSFNAATDLGSSALQLHCAQPLTLTVDSVRAVQGF